MRLREIWERYNVSTLLVLPIYSHICKQNTYKKNKKIKMPFIQICLESGLQNTYLTEDRFLIHFDRSVMKEHFIINSDSYSLSELIIASKYFDKIVVSDENQIVYSLFLPDKYLTDFEFIRQSRYSRVSLEYKNELLITQNTVALLKNELSNNISRYNLPYSIATKSKHLRKDLVSYLTVDKSKPIQLSENSELFIKFNPELETFNYDNTDITS
jgi:hypothetical protein